MNKKTAHRRISKSPNQKEVFHHNLFGIGMMMLHVVGLSVLYALAKTLTKDLSSSLVLFLYKVTLLVCILPWCFKGGLKSMKTHRIWLHMTRGFLSGLGGLCMFYSLQFIGLSDVTAIAYMEQIILLIISIVYFNERATKTKFFVIILSFIGAIFIIQPGFILNLLGIHTKNTPFNVYYTFVFLAVIFWALNNTVIKVLGQTEKTKVQTFYVLLFSSIIAFPSAFMEWSHFGHIGNLEIKYPDHFLDFSKLGITATHMFYISILAGCYFIHVVGHFKAFKHADLSVVIPFEYLRLVCAAILGYLLFKEVPGANSYIGYILIIFGGLFLFHSEHRKLKRKKAREIEDSFDQA